MKHQRFGYDSERSASDLLKPSDLYAAVVHGYSRKCENSSVATLFGGVMGGALLGLAGLFYIIVMADNSLSGGIAKLIGGVCFSLGLVMISITGAELFTGNVLALLPKAYRMISARAVLQNWVAVYVSNFFGAMAVALSAAGAGLLSGPAATSLTGLTMSKLAHPPTAAFIEGVLANFLVCLAIWMGLATQSPSGRILCIAGPITAFVAMGLEHSIANMFFFSAAFFSGSVQYLSDMAASLLIVTFGNITGAFLLCLFMGFAFRNSQSALRNLPTIDATRTEKF